jgi:hypothetical protein
MIGYGERPRGVRLGMCRGWMDGEGMDGCSAM